VTWLRAPLFWILAVAAGLRLAGLFWGLPASDGWDDDGFAPRNFLTALALTYKPGAFFTYPPLHAFLMALLTLPGVVIALLQVPSFSQADVVGEFTKPGTMTYFAVVARLLNLAMSLGIIWCVGEMTRLIAGARAGLFAAAACTLGVLLTYYGQVSNLDVPYLFWSLLALLWCMRAIVEQNIRRVWGVALFAAAAIATKDQAAAIFALSLPAILLLWFAADDWPRRNARAVLTTLLLSASVALVALLTIDGAITNPSGFARRIAFLTGPASGNYAAYENGPSGWLALSGDMADYFLRGYAAVAVLLAGVGLALHLAHRRERPVWIAGLLPFMALVSFTLCFNFTALRTDGRFLLPQAVMATIYIGIAADALAFAFQGWLRCATRAALAVTALFALHHCIAINAAMIFDPRYDAEKWMAAHISAGETIETYGQNAYLPRFPADTMVSRIGDRPLTLRNPLPRVTERREPYDAVAGREPRFIVVSEWWLRHYTEPQSELGGRRMPSKAQQALFNDLPARRYFTALREGRLNYRLAHAAAPVQRLWPLLHIHESLNETILIFERKS
jgi:4-amino-4-deoxy-L-arabinose transferase-like glycosyltransferase